MKALFIQVEAIRVGQQGGDGQKEGDLPSRFGSSFQSNTTKTIHRRKNNLISNLLTEKGRVREGNRKRKRKMKKSSVTWYLMMNSAL